MQQKAREEPGNKATLELSSSIFTYPNIISPIVNKVLHYLQMIILGCHMHWSPLMERKKRVDPTTTVTMHIFMTRCHGYSSCCFVYVAIN